MTLYSEQLKKHRGIICVLVIILIFQAIFALALPHYTGKLTGVGIQQKGIDSDYPEKLTEEAFGLFNLVLPEEEHQKFISCYDNHGEFFAFSAQADCETAKDIYENGILSGFYIALDKAEKHMGSFDSDSIESMMNLATVSNLYSTLRRFDSPTETEKNDYYLKAQQAPDSLKGQIAGMALPYFYSDAGGSVEENQKSYFLRCGAVMSAFVLLQMICFVVAGRISAKISSRIRADFRHEFIEHTSKFNLRQRRLVEKELYGVFTADITNVGTVTEYLLSVFLYSPFVLIGGIIMSFRISAALSAVVILTVFAAMGIIFVIYKVTLPAYDRLQHFYGTLVKNVKTSVNQLYTVRTMQTADFERNRYLSASDNVRKNERFVLKSVFNALSLITLLSNVITAVAVIVSGKSLLSADMGVGDVIAFLQYSVLTVSAVTTVAVAFLFAPRAKCSFDNIDEIMNIKIIDHSGGTELDESIKTVEFRNVSLENGIEKVSFVAERGKITAFTGPTGCGKTSLLKMLTDVSMKKNGEVLLNGISVENICLESIRNKVSFAHAAPMIFSVSLRDNMILYGAESEEAMDAALEGAAVDFVENKDVILHNGASRYSGGQRSRIVLACALSKKADVYIIDDCLKAVDSDTEERILDYLQELCRNSVVIIVTGRINSLIRADKTIVLSENNIHSVGTHSELMKSCEFYKELASLQGMEVSNREN